MDAEVALVDMDARPDPGGDLLLADHLTCALDQAGQDVQRARADSDRRFALEQKLLRGNQPEWSERHRVARWPGLLSRSMLHSDTPARSIMRFSEALPMLSEARLARLLASN
jgi:hypothetical protein